MPVDPFGGGYHSPDEGIWYGDDYGGGPSWMDLIGQGIDRAAQAYAIGEAGYPQQPQWGPYCGPSGCGPQPQTAQQMPQFTLQPTAPLPQPVQQGGFQISTTMALVLGIAGFAFFFGKRGR